MLEGNIAPEDVKVEGIETEEEKNEKEVSCLTITNAYLKNGIHRD